MKEVTAICTKCGPVKISGTWTDQTEEAFYVPVALAPTIQALGKVYKHHTGDRFSFMWDDKISNAFERKTLELSHLSIDEGGEEMDKHLLEPMECWSLIL